MLVSVIIFVNILHNVATFFRNVEKFNFLFIYLFILLLPPHACGAPGRGSGAPMNTARRSSGPASGSR
jgi:hypothetical protein